MFIKFLQPLLRKPNLSFYRNYCTERNNRILIAYHEACHSAFLIKNPNYWEFQKLEIFVPNSLEFVMGIKGVTLFKYQNNIYLTNSLINRLNKEIVFDLIGKVGELLIADGKAIEDDAWTDVEWAIENIKSISSINKKIITKSDEIYQLNQADEEVFDNKIGEAVDFIIKNQKLIHLLATTALLENIVRDIDIPYIKKNEFPCWTVEKIIRENLNINDINPYNNHEIKALKNIKFVELFKPELEKIKEKALEKLATTPKPAPESLLETKTEQVVPNQDKKLEKQSETKTSFARNNDCDMTNSQNF